jgi:hypothetical protein
MPKQAKSSAKSDLNTGSGKIKSTPLKPAFLQKKSKAE